MLAVSDGGCGMDRRTQERVFEPFFSTKELVKGTGLGPSTAFGIVKQSGGAIWVYREPGQETTFKGYLPRSVAPAETAVVPTVPVTRLHGSETVLLVEADEHVRGLAGAILSNHGCHVLEAPTNGEALRIDEESERAIDVLLTDVVLRMSGTCRAYRRGTFSHPHRLHVRLYR